MTVPAPLILCVDDEKHNRNLLRAVLVPRGFEVIEAADGAQALEATRKHRPDLILLDVMMPGMDGHAVCRAIKEDPSTRDIPVIMVTSMMAKAERIKSIEAGAEEFLTKPFDKAEILARVAMLLKVKDLSDRLGSAYANISQITTFGRAIARMYDPFKFDLPRAMDKVVELILGRVPDPAKPSQVVVGLKLGGRSWGWYLYERGDDKLQRTALKLRLEVNMDLPEGKAARVVSFSGPELADKEIADVVGKLRKSSIPVDNMLCFLSDDVCFMVLNYRRPITPYDADVINAIVAHTVFLKTIYLQMNEISDSFDYSLQALARASEANDDDTGNHIHRVGEYCALLAKELSMPEKFVRSIRVQALTHDVGKIHLPPHILQKPGALTPQEWEVMKLHPQYGANILGDSPRLAMASSIAFNHHERFDGTGYPRAISGEAIPVEARILTLADQYDALRNARVYKPAFGHAKTFEIITKGDGRTLPGHFDPRVLAAFKKIAERFEQTYDRLRDSPELANEAPIQA
ncbi:MAG: response regulator [Desulfovibrionaceae bacterium]|nr:response regulator [Desulfovibrionaceae bacterium]MBF0514426.1 response regulator [Desulfovibrionaceae bacterium]